MDVTASVQTAGWTAMDGSAEVLRANDVYYTVVTGFEVWKSRALVVHNSSATFWQARQVCINEGGDLASLTSLRAIQATVKLANAKDIQSSVWFGLWQRPEKDTFVYEWTNVETVKYSQQVLASFWADRDFEDDDSQHCAALSLANYTVYSTNCSDYRPFVCFQPSPPGANVDGENAAATEAPDRGPSMLAFYIVMPFFVLCYGGSCLVYCVHKTCRQCRRHHHRRMAVASSSVALSDMSRDRPPSWIAAAPPSAPPGEYKHREATSDTASQLPSQRSHDAARPAQKRFLIVTTTEENETHTGKTQRRTRTRTTGSAESVTDIRIREGEMAVKRTERTERKRRREAAIKSRLLDIEDALELKKEFGKERRGTRKILVA
ncbi:hypothetical protein NP493_53g20025 [Ridgeia piscesae]|uniref:C-type lectin domain-containing protein n=1 Tax=Ridgeia piscesae TaxID=27915 RepID=A0AAD9PB68_RIDPI|nr:hypothetical protein NP493_53g20025 [Ridgeia piscesae]